VWALSLFGGWVALHTGRMESNGQADGRPLNNEFSRVTSPTAHSENFDEVVLPHLDAAYRLALRLMRNEHDAEDVVQEASLRAFRYFRTFAGGNGRAWFLRIVRNTCFGWRARRFDVNDRFDEERHRGECSAPNPESLLLQTGDATLIARAMGHLPDRFHRLLVLRELDGLSYRELAGVIGVPLGTVMSRLSRARQALRQAVDNELNRSGISERAHSRLEGPGTVLMRSVSWNRRHARPVDRAEVVCDVHNNAAPHRRWCRAPPMTSSTRTRSRKEGSNNDRRTFDFSCLAPNAGRRRFFRRASWRALTEDAGGAR